MQNANKPSLAMPKLSISFFLFILFTEKFLTQNNGSTPSQTSLNGRLHQNANQRIKPCRNCGFFGVRSPFDVGMETPSPSVLGKFCPNRKKKRGADRGRHKYTRANNKTPSYKFNQTRNSFNYASTH